MKPPDIIVKLQIHLIPFMKKRTFHHKISQVKVVRVLQLIRISRRTFPRVTTSSASRPPIMSLSLAQRFEKVRKSQDQAEKQVDLEQVSFEDLQNRTIQFGKTKMGQPYHQVMHEDPGYVTWFVKSYGDSQKPSHREFLVYIERYTEIMEAKGGLETTAAYPKPETKAKKTQGELPGAPTGSMTPKPHKGSHQMIEEDEEDSDWDAVTSVLDIKAENASIQNRLSQMETVMQHMMQALSQIQQQQLQPQPKA